MDAKYAGWIEANVVGKCDVVTALMQDDFPELRRVRGHYHCPIWGERGHWWLVTSSGEVIDPTKVQFPSNGIGEYIEWDDSRPEPIANCPNCGGYVYNNETTCSDACSRELLASLSGGLPMRTYRTSSVAKDRPL